MRIASWSWGGRHHVGIVSSDGQQATPWSCPDALALIEALSRGEPCPPASGPRVAVSAVTLLAPIPRPRRNLFCVGRNYHSHAQELSGSVFKASMPKEHQWPMVFTKFPETVTGPHDTVRLPGAAVSEQIDYESELAVVIGRGGRDISAARAMDHVFGYTVANDVSARDVQVRHQQWMLGKNCDTFCPMGPWIATADELDARDTRLRGWVTPAGAQAELRQDAQTRDMIFDIPTLIETCSRGITLLPGDIILTGTPAGVGMGYTPAKWLRAGDVVRIEIDGIGAIENRFE